MAILARKSMTKKEKVAIAVVLLLILVNLIFGAIIIAKIAESLGAAAKLKG